MAARPRQADVVARFAVYPMTAMGASRRDVCLQTKRTAEVAVTAAVRFGGIAVRFGAQNCINLRGAMWPENAVSLKTGFFDGRRTTRRQP